MKSRFTKLYLLLILALLTTACVSVESESSEIKYAYGTVKYISLEGGFYGIVTDDYKNLDPLNLPREFQRDGLKIFFKYVEKKNMASTHMWGMIIEIIEIKELK